jgi:hypothetical protein
VLIITPTEFTRLPVPVRSASNNRRSGLAPNSSKIQKLGASPNAGPASAASERDGAPRVTIKNFNRLAVMRDRAARRELRQLGNKCGDLSVHNSGLILGAGNRNDLAAPFA